MAARWTQTARGGILTRLVRHLNLRFPTLFALFAVREGTLLRRERDRALSVLRADIAALWVGELMPEIAQASVALLARHPLRTGAGVQLASCLYLRREMAEDVPLLAYDARLNEVARAEGCLCTTPPESPSCRPSAPHAEASLVA